MLSTWLDNTQTWAEPDSLSHFQRAIPLEWIAHVLESTDKASIRKRKFPAELVVWLIIGMGLYRDRPSDKPLEALFHLTAQHWTQQEDKGSINLVFAG